MKQVLPVRQVLVVRQAGSGDKVGIGGKTIEVVVVRQAQSLTIVPGLWLSVYVC